jgi:hypothetical protein
VYRCNLRSDAAGHWSDTSYAPNSLKAWIVGFFAGGINYYNKYYNKGPFTSSALSAAACDWSFPPHKEKSHDESQREDHGHAPC